MNENTERLDAIQARVEAATPGPWRWDENYGEANDTGLALTNEAGAEIVGAYNHHCCSFRDDPSVEDTDAEFIAAAPSDVAFLLDLARKQQAALDAAAKLAEEWDAVFEMFPAAAAGVFAKSHANRLRDVVTAALGDGNE